MIKQQEMDTFKQIYHPRVKIKYVNEIRKIKKIIMCLNHLIEKKCLKKLL